MTKINTFIFDIDGTLIDTFDMYMPAMVETLRKHGYPVKDEQATMKQQSKRNGSPWLTNVRTGSSPSQRFLRLSPS